MKPRKINDLRHRVTRGDGLPTLFISLTRVEKFGESVTNRHRHLVDTFARAVFVAHAMDIAAAKGMDIAIGAKEATR